ncbi:MAG: P-loop domain-containing protein [Clostridium sp.]
MITDDTALKLRAEDGRSIGMLTFPCSSMIFQTKDARCFSTEDASGSTPRQRCHQGIERSRVFLIDEDTSATNFMVRDDLMRRS